MTKDSDGELEALGLLPRWEPFPLIDARLLSHLALLLGMGHDAFGGDTIRDLPKEWFPWYPHQSAKAADSVGHLDREYLEASKDVFCEQWKDVKVAASRGKLPPLIDATASAAVSGLNYLAAYDPARARSDLPAAARESRDALAALRCNTTPFLLTVLLADKYRTIRAENYPLLLFLSRHRMHTDNRTAWEALGAAPLLCVGEKGRKLPGQGSEPDLDVLSLLQNAQKVRPSRPDKLPACAALLMVVRELAKSLLQDSRLLASAPYRKLLWESVDAVAWYAIIRGLFAEIHPECPHLPVSLRPPAERFLWLLAEYGYVVLGVERDLRVHEHFRRAMQHEVLLYHSRTEYRDHIFHAIDTFLCGFVLLKTTHSPFRSLLATRSRSQKKEILRNWFLAALFHDFGYAMELVSLTFRVASQFPVCCAEALVSGLNREWESQITELNCAVREEQSLISEIGQKRTDHGVFSYLHLRSELQRLDTIATIKNDLSGPPSNWSSEHCRKYATSLNAILKHNLVREPVSVRQEPLTALLVLCDEIQEWHRPRYNTWDLVRKSVAAIHEHQLLDTSVRRVSEAVFFVDCKWKKGNVVFAATRPRIIVRYADQNLHRFDPLSRVLQKIYNLQRLMDFDGANMLLEIEIRRLPREPRTIDAGEQAMDLEQISELDILRDFSLLREVGVSPELFVRQSSPEDGRRCVLLERRDVDVIRLDLALLGQTPARHSPLVSVPPWEFEKRLLDFKREFCRRNGVVCSLFNDDEEWPEQQIAAARGFAWM